MNTPPLLLASSSPYRKALLARLRLPFETLSPDVDETPRTGESPAELALRLARAKAEAAAAERPGVLVIGSDQVASLGDRILGKPGDAGRAAAQLNACSGRSVRFHTGLCVLSPAEPVQQALVPVTVQFRRLSGPEIDRYLALDQPFDCAGSFKWESLGISLFERLLGDDPTALEGLPLIALCGMLRRAGLDPLA